MTENCKQNGNPLSGLVQVRSEKGRQKNSGLIFYNCRISVESCFPSPPDIFQVFLVLSQKMLRNTMLGRDREVTGQKYEFQAVCICSVDPMCPMDARAPCTAQGIWTEKCLGAVQ